MLRVLPLVLVLWTEPSPAPSSIPRFEKIADGLFRGGQPDKAGFEYLKSQGIRTVINLRGENDEEPIVNGLGIQYVHIPMAVMPWSKISQKSIKSYFEVLNDPANYPIFVHCRRGADRTGVMVALYRIVAQGWDGKKAVKEARDIGMRWWYLGLKGQIKGFAKPANLALFTLKPATQTLD